MNRIRLAQMQFFNDPAGFYYAMEAIMKDPEVDEETKVYLRETYKGWGFINENSRPQAPTAILC